MKYKEQVHELDCALSVIQILYKHHYKQWLSMASIKTISHYSQSGINIKELINIGLNFDLKLEALEGNIENLKLIKINNNPFITIIEQNNRLHYVVISKITKNYILYTDPQLGEVKDKWDTFQKKYKNIIITVEPTSKEKPKTLENITPNIVCANIWEIIWFTLISLLILMLGLLSTFYLKIILDQILPSFQRSELIYISIYFILFLIFRLILNYCKSYFLYRSNIRFQTNLIELYINKIKKVNWMQIKHLSTSSYLKNLEMISYVAQFKSNYISTITSEIICFVISTIVLIYLDLTIFIITFIFTVANIVLSLAFKPLLASQEKEMYSQSIVTQNSFLNIANAIDKFKVPEFQTLLKNTYHKEWEKSLQISKKNTFTKWNFQLLQSLITSTIPYVIVIMSVQKIWSNELTIANMLIFMAIFNFFVSPLDTFTSMLLDLPIYKNYLDNLNAFFRLKEEENLDQGLIIANINEIQITNLNFEYDAYTSFLSINNLFIKNKTIVQGSNGSGKTTLFKLISGLIPVPQAIKFNGTFLSECNLTSIRENICFIESKTNLCASTIYEYITCNKATNSQIFIQNLDKYNLLNYFYLLNLNLYSTIDQFGTNFSNGQKQFIALMKIFSSNYSVVILDEAFENLDRSFFESLKPILMDYLEEKIVLETSHSGTYIFPAEEVVNCDQFKK